MERYLRDLLYGLPYKSAHLQKLQKYVPTRFLVLFLFFTSETGGNFLKHESFLLWFFFCKVEIVLWVQNLKKMES